MAAPYGPPRDLGRPTRRRRGGVVGPLVLIFIGAVFLLQNTGYLPADAWLSLWRLWPLVLVLVGLELLLGPRVPWLALAALAVVIMAVGLAMFTVTTPRSAPAGGEATRSAETRLGGASQAAVSIRFGAGQLTVGPLAQAGQDQLALMSYSGPPDLMPTPQYSVVGTTGRLDYGSGGRPGPGPGFNPFAGGRGDTAAHFEVDLAPQVPITSFVLQTGATDAHIDLSTLQVSNLELSVGAATTWIRLPEAAGTTTGHVSGGASKITLEIPQGVAAQISHRGGLSTLAIDQGRFPQVAEGVYRSPDYQTAANKVDLTMETGVTSIQVD